MVCVCVCVLATYSGPNSAFYYECEDILGGEDSLAGPHKFRGLFEGLKVEVTIGFREVSEVRVRSQSQGPGVRWDG